jgi:hypothetical protein
MCISYDVLKIETREKKKLFRKGKLEGGGGPAEPVARSLITEPPTYACMRGFMYLSLH